MRPMKVHGQIARSPRLTPIAAALVALAIAVPGGGLIGLIAWAFG